MKFIGKDSSGGNDFHSATELALRNQVEDLDLSESELAIVESIFNTQEGLLIVDADLKIVRVNKAFTEITGYLAEDVIGENPRILSSGRHDKDFYENMWERLGKDGRWEGKIWNRRKNGEIYLEYLNISVVHDQFGSVANYVSIITDIAKIKKAIESITNIAFYNSLTRLPNRRLFIDKMSQEIDMLAISGGKGALFFLDLDYFKNLNDTLGHHEGDLMLQKVAERLASCVKKTDLLAHLSGDEFFIFLTNVDGAENEFILHMQNFAQTLIEIFKVPFLLNNHSYSITASIGIAMFSSGDSSLDVILKQADIAMYRAKSLGRNTSCFFEKKFQDDIAYYVKTESELRKAIELNQFELFYQVQVNDKKVPFGAEVLIRWMHPERGIIAPGSFINIAEEAGLIVPIGKWVLSAACKQLKSWEDVAVLQDLTLSVNVSSKQINQSDFVEHVKSIVCQSGINPKKLKLELTESALADNIDELISSMTRLKDIGIQFELDDFGTGYSSLQYLKRLPLEQLKIDQSFVREIETNSSDQQIAKTIISMAQIFDFHVIAEGVETEGQKQVLLNSGCVRFQGYLFGRPLPLGSFEKSIFN